MGGQRVGLLAFGVVAVVFVVATVSLLLTPDLTPD
jgi:hypothetical protein